MTGESGEKRLLDDLSRGIGCAYVSDLHEVRWQTALVLALQNIRASDYSVEMWNEAVTYIMNQKTEFSSVREAYEYLLDFSVKLCLEISKK